MTAREDLEGAIWRVWPTRGPEAGKAVDAILAAADAYALAEYGITADRRAAIGASTATAQRDLRAELAVHYAPSGRVSACGHVKHAVGHRPDMTAHLASVTCLSCVGTRQYREAVACA